MNHRRTRLGAFTLGLASLWMQACSTHDLGDQTELQEPDPLVETDARSDGLTKGNPGALKGANDYCNDPANLCGPGEGDCDASSQCQPGLVCGTDLGPRFGFGASTDVCVAPHCLDGIQDANETGIDVGDGCGVAACPPASQNGGNAFCSLSCPCAAGQGDCDSTSECQAGLLCAFNVGARFGMASGADVCVAAQCLNGLQDPTESGVDCGGPCAPCQDAPGGDGGSGGSAACEDACAVSSGIKVGCEQRFLYGLNYAWRHFGADFGGVQAWGQKGVAAEPAAHAANLQAMRASGASVVRWWVLPDLRSDGVQLDAQDTPTGLGGTMLADLDKALELAAEKDVWLVLTLFSFDGFRPSEQVGNLWVPGLTPMVKDAGQRAALLEKVVRPLAQAAARSKHADRLLAWDLINEPEWAIRGSDPYGDPPFDPSYEVDAVSFSEMESFLKEVTTTLRQESKAQITVGGAAAKWARAWTGLGLDFYQFHTYAWINTWWPYTTPASAYGLDRPLVMGEAPVGNLVSGVPFSKLATSLFSEGYAGAWAWDFTSATAAQLQDVKSVQTKLGCSVTLGSTTTATTAALP